MRGLDGKMVILCALVVTDTLTYIYNLCTDKHYFPKAFKLAKAAPIYNSVDSREPLLIDYLNSVTSKLVEKHTNNHLLSQPETNQLRLPNQSGLRELHSYHPARIT